MQAWITLECSLIIQWLKASFLLGTSRPLRSFHRILGLMSAASSVIPVLVQIHVLYQCNPPLHQTCRTSKNFFPVSIRLPIWTDLQTEGSHDRCLQLGLGSSVGGHTGGKSSRSGGIKMGRIGDAQHLGEFFMNCRLEWDGLLTGGLLKESPI